MENHLDYDTWTGRTAYDRDGDKIGKITDLYYDNVTGRPEWVEVKAGLFKGTRLVPLAGARIEAKVTASGDPDDDDDRDERLVVNYDGDLVSEAPDMDTDDDALSVAQEQDLYSHYGFDWNDMAGGDYGYGQAWEQRRFDVEHQAQQQERAAHASRLRRYAAEVRNDRS